MYTRTQRHITLDGAQAIIAAALADGKARGRELSVAVVDAGGHIVAIARSDGAEIQTVQIAERKARTSAFTGVPSGPKSKAGNVGSDHHLLAITLAGGVENVVTVQGGVPIIVDGECIGGVGVSGAAHADGEIAAAGVTAAFGA
ncbi:heme-binding protein [Novosphingobium flavum]|uniref:Heme-binding protein n=1 Tax=Novosphingobium flavum TaxID=1778672 RepID=A0A7X1FQ53_9SPHN|nr:heme-binding protein [Novosphingobium flavum]MBC2664926.1 heme-binding protein [Novosphingobium flavum]